MKEKYNWKSLCMAAVLTIGGIILIVASTYVDIEPWISICSGIGCSIIASAIVIVAHDFIIEKVLVSPLDEWGIKKIYATRAEKNADSDPSLEKANYCVDGIAFGLSSFRTKYSKKVEQCLRKGVNFRLLVMNPNGLFIEAREKEEKGDIKPSINDLVCWANALNQKQYKGKIIVKGYNSMTLDFYWRVDNEIYVGPYWYGYKSSDTITFKYDSSGKAFTLYADYFESLWENKELTVVLTDVETIAAKKKSKRR